MDWTYAIAYYKEYNSIEDNIHELRSSYIWEYDTPSLLKYNGSLNKAHRVNKNEWNLGRDNCLIFGEAYKINRNELFDIIMNNPPEMFEGSDFKLLNTEYYYFVIEDWD